MRVTDLILTFTLLLTLSSCSTEINIGDYINTNSSLTLSINKTTQDTGLTNSQKVEISPDSEKFKKIIDWGVNNQSSWTKTPASYISEVSVTQNDFRLLYNHDFVVVGFTNKNGEPLQYSKKVKSGELDFLAKMEWKIYKQTYIDAGFILTFKYPENIVVADIIDNCICVGERTKFYYEQDEASSEANTNQWCICVFDKSEYTGDYLANSWKEIFKNKFTEQKDSIVVNDIKALQVILKSNDKAEPYIHLIYLEKFSTLFEITNNDESTEKDFETFYNEIKIEKIIKPSP
jgi:hypothetical protein